MISVFGEDIINACTGGGAVKAIYNYGVKVWPVSNYSYYIKWSPLSASGSFTLNSETMNMGTYPGYYEWESGIIDSSAFMSTGITSFVTNAVSVNECAFQNCSLLTQASLSSCKYIGVGAFSNCKSLTSVHLEHCSTIDSYAFYSDPLLEGVWPRMSLGPTSYITYIGSYAFCDCTNFASVGLVLSNCSYIGNYAFKNCLSLYYGNFQGITVVNEGVFDGCNQADLLYINSGFTYIGSYAFRNCSLLTSITLYNASTLFSCCSYIGSSAFKGCNNLFRSVVILNLPICEYIGAYAFYECTFAWVSAPMCSSIHLRAFDQCSNLTSMSFRNCSIITGLLNAPSLETIVLASTSVVQLANSSAFVGCPRLSEIYVPVSLITQYKNDSVWSWYSSLFSLSNF